MPVLKDLLENSKDGEWGKSEPFDESVEMSVIRGTDFESARVGSVEGVPERFIAKRHHDRKVLKPWDILLETAGGSKNRPTGRTLLVKPALLRTLGKPATCASFARFLRIDNSKAYPPYVFWLLQHLYSNGILFKYHTQHTGVARFQYTSFAENEELILPSLDLQVHIASILSAYDDLIENNTRRIEILEEMARRLYEEWFVNFRFPGHEKVSLPFEEANIFDVFSVKYGKGLPKKNMVEDGEYPVYGAAKVIGRYTSFNYESRQIIAGCRGSVGEFRITEPKSFVTNNSFIFSPVVSDDFFWGYQALKHRGLKDVVGGAAQPQITLDGLRSVNIAYPEHDVRRKYSELVSPMFSMMWSLERKNANLRAQRDLLLPKLVSGEIDVSDISMPDDKEVEAA